MPYIGMHWVELHCLLDSLHHTALRAIIPLLPLGKSETSWLQKSLIARALAASPPNIFLGEALPSISLDEVDLYRGDRMRLTRLRCRHYITLRLYKNRLYPKIDSA